MLDDVWIVLATTMFLTGPFRRGGLLHPIVQANLALEPESVSLAELLAHSSHPLVQRGWLTDALDTSWNQLQAAGQRRRQRLNVAR